MQKGRQQTIVISLGGSLICPQGVDTRFLKQFIAFAKKQSKHTKIIIITGGGAYCRAYNAAFDAIIQKPTAKSATLSKDMMGIHMTRMNALFLQQLLIHSNLKVDQMLIGDPAQKIEWGPHRIAIGAGYLPGHSTDYDAVLAAAANGAKTVINLTNVPHVYTRDPRKYKDAKPIKFLTWQEYREVLGVKKWSAGLHTPFDPMASALAEKRKLQIIITNDVRKKGTSIQ